MTKPAALTLTSPQLLAALERLDGERLEPWTLKYYARIGLLPPSVEWPERGGRGVARVYNLHDLARLRLVQRLRREFEDRSARSRKGNALQRVRLIIATIESQLPEVLKPNTRAVLEVDGPRARVIVRRPGHADVEIPGGQLRLPLVDVMKRNAEIARDVQRVA